MECEIAVRVTPRSSQNKISVERGAVKVWVTAAPTDGQANEAVCKFVAKKLGVAPSRVAIIRGEAGREKILHVEGLSAEAAGKLLA